MITTPPSGYKTLKTLFAALLVGQLLFAGVAFYLVQQKIFKGVNEGLTKLLLPVAVIIAVVCTLAAANLFKKRIKNCADVQLPLTDRFNEYRAALIIRWAMLEAPCLFCIIGFMLTGDRLFLLITGLLLAFFATTYPAKEKVSAHMGISIEELESIP